MKNKATFYYQTGIFHENDDDVIKAILKVYSNVFLLDSSFQLKHRVPDFDHNRYVRGSINLIDYLSNYNSIMLTMDSQYKREDKIPEYYDYDKFGTDFRKILINYDFAVVDINYLVFELEGGMYKESFLRSVSSKKLLSGGLYTQKQVETELMFLKDKNFPIVIASPKKISKEYRFFIKNKTVIDGCQYMKDGELCIENKVPDEVRTFAHVLAQKIISSERMHVIDIGECGDKIGLIEMNDYRTSSFYGCDFEKILRYY